MATLLFKSGFESATAIGSLSGGYRRLTGIDASSGFDWGTDIKLWGSDNASELPGIHEIQDGGTADITNEIVSMTGHLGGTTNVLHQLLENGTGGVIQSPFQINEIDIDPAQFYVSMWMKIADMTALPNDTWHLLFQYKSDQWYDQNALPGFRISGGVYKNYAGNYYWTFQGDDNPSSPTWLDEPSFGTIPYTFGEWFHLEYYYKFSDDTDGRAWMKINDQIVGDRDGANLGDATDTLSFIN